MKAQTGANEGYKMAVNHGKIPQRLTGTEENKEKAMTFFQSLYIKPLHRWLPFLQLKETGVATITIIQSDWLWLQCRRRGIDIGFQTIGQVQMAVIENQ
jgi:hypothetical protein